MVKGFAEQAGGGVEIESTPGVGTTVSLWLPVTEPVEPPALPRPLPIEVIADKSGVRVLLVDDEPMVRDVLTFGLEDAGFAVLTAASGAEAIALLDAGAPVDVLVTDYAMSAMDGLALIRQARSTRPDLPCLVLTGYVQGISSDAEQTAAAIGVLRKPISARKLASSIQAALAVSRNGTGTDGTK
jgi:CheY-like chemotaxis protein